MQPPLNVNKQQGSPVYRNPDEIISRKTACLKKNIFIPATKINKSKMKNIFVSAVGILSCFISGAQSWNITGNAGTNPVNNFLGTTDNQPLLFRVNNSYAGKLDGSRGNYFFGKAAGQLNTGSFNIAMGDSALRNNTGGRANIAFGYKALYSNTITGGMVAIGYSSLFNNGLGVTNGLSILGTNNTALGSYSLFSNTTGYRNTGMGADVMYSNISGWYNTAFGYRSMYAGATGYSNVAIGPFSLYSNIAGSNLVAVGDSALYNNNGSVKNTAIGSKAGYSTTTGGSNNFIGYRSGYSNTTGSNNSFTGYQSGYFNTTGRNNTATGVMALYSNTTAKYNTATGVSALYSNTTGESNTASGNNALYFNTTGERNGAIGVNALYNNTTGSGNIAVGNTALFNNTTGSQSVAIGDSALYSGGYRSIAVGYKASYSGGGGIAIGNQALYFGAPGAIAIGEQALYSGSPFGANSIAVGYQALYSGSGFDGNDIAIGYRALYSGSGYEGNNIAIGSRTLELRGGSSNIAIGRAALYRNAGFENIAIGRYTGSTMENGYFNTLLGTDIYGADSLWNSTAIGARTAVHNSNQVVIGDSYITSIGGHVNWTAFSDGRFKKNIRNNVHGLDFILQLKPVTYTVDTKSLHQWLRKNDTATDSRKKFADKHITEQKNSYYVYSGLVAQEVEQTAKKIGYDFSGVDAPGNPDGVYGLRYAEFVVPLIKAMQEQQTIIEELKQRLLILEKQNSKINLLEVQVQQKGKKTVLIYPNPSGNFITVQSEEQFGQALITDVNGRTVKQVNHLPGLLKIDVGDITPGIYFIRLISGEATFTGKFIRQ